MSLKSKIYQLLYLLLISMGLNSCGASSNLLGLTAPKADHEAFDVLVTEARFYYDRGNLEKAKDLIDKAYKIDPTSETASLTYGYIYLALGGIMPFTLARLMMGQNEDEKETSLLAGSGGTDKTLRNLNKTIGLSQDEIQNLGDLDSTDPDLPILIPKCANEARSIVEKLAYVNRAIAAICPFVDPEVRIDEEPRHVCESTPYLRSRPAKAHFLWSFGHLTEALAFHSVLTYSTTGDKNKTNLELKVAQLDELQPSSPAELTQMIDEISAIEKTVSKVMPTSGLCSEQHPQYQMTAVLNDMVAVNLGFARMPGVPESMTKSISKAMEKIQKLRDSADSSSEDQSKALKGDLTKGMTSSLGTTLDQMAAENPDITPEQKTQVCDSYKSMQGGGEEVDPATLPVLCQ